MEWQQVIGYIAGIFTSMAVIPQIAKAWRTRKVDDISLITVSILICGLGLWTFYGILNKAWPIIITNGISCLLNCFLCGLVCYEKRKQKSA